MDTERNLTADELAALDETAVGLTAEEVDELETHECAEEN